MANKFGIPHDIEILIRKRDKNCVYCHKKMIYPFHQSNPIDFATIEHLNHRQDWNSVESYVQEGLPVDEIVTICCKSCNSSRGSKPLKDWFESQYCQGKNINYNTVAKVVKNYIDKYEQLL
ncbi:MAG: hypothetical protein Q7T54_00470 [Candidatus Levybacteria bacterium]|nr:hypothetical protein [Candidatus Levybacteria bacterium]